METNFKMIFEKSTGVASFIIRDEMDEKILTKYIELYPDKIIENLGITMEKYYGFDQPCRCLKVRISYDNLLEMRKFRKSAWVLGKSIGKDKEKARD